MMNIKSVYTKLLEELKDKEKAKACLLIFITAVEEFATNEFSKHIVRWCVFRQEEMKEEVKQL